VAIVSGNAFTPMSRSTLFILRVLAIGGALTVLACHVVRRQQEATAGAAGDRGTAGEEAAAPTRVPGTKSVVVQSRQPVVKLKPANPAPAPATPNPDIYLYGTKSAAVLKPADLQPAVPNPAPPAAPAPQPPVRAAIPSTKSARMITPAEVQRFQQQQAPAAQQSATPQR